ncbi:pyrimidine reductase family protein [Actinomycetospora callitridis]|uniref:pyrimidine reductase family protein n=1 Tax=Actinomycetospora callitridis TaxID=913944 RepID=UPI002365AD27|nr:pyrimidine reductase family protein [Actinomycetospora callitridis]MDD7920633.1 pyrimidine reductase family protein [Actinomycetospora callitridis]
MRLVWPLEGTSPRAAPERELDRDDLAELYAHPEGVLRVNFVASADGAVAVDGVSSGLEAPGDRTVFGLLRELADVILVGAGSVRAEGYRGARTSPEREARRRARGRAPVPPIAVVSTRGDLDPASPLFTDTAIAPLVLLTGPAPESARSALTGAGAEVVDVGGAPDSTPAAVVAALADRGLSRVLCEGGPALFGALLDAGCVDELCLSLAPQLEGGTAGRIVAGAGSGGPRPLHLASVVAHDDGLLLRYQVGGPRP